jgi:putative spermidine/putrescine transport system permease protein
MVANGRSIKKLRYLDPSIVMVNRAAYWRSQEALLVLPALLFYVLLYLYPLSRLGAWSVFDPGPTLKNYRQLVADPVYAKALLNTLEVSFWATIFSLLLGYPLAYLMTVSSRRTRAWLMALVMVPFWTSILVRSFAWVVILGTNGIVNKALVALGLIERPAKLLYNLLGVEIGMVHVLLPFMIFPLYGVMAQIDMGLLRAGRSLGAPPWRAFLAIFLPLSLPGVAAGCVLVFLMAVGFYITPALLGGPQQITLATLIEMMVSDLLNWGFGATLSVLLVAAVAGLFVVFSAALGVERLTGGGARR